MDHVKRYDGTGVIALEIEWNNKDPFFDRDLENFKRLHAEGAISVGIVRGQPMLDLCYEEDSSADVDMTIVCSGTGDFIEVQGTAEGAPFDRDLLNQLLDLGQAGCAELTRMQAEALAEPVHR